jgi:DNA-binding response OmpR family regulator
MKILFAEDEIRQQGWLTRILSNTGHEVSAACDGDWGVRLTGQFQYQ